MNNLKQVLEKILKKSPQYERKSREMRLLESWPQIVGERIAKHAWAERTTEDGTLIIATENSSWNHHLHFMERQIVQKLQDTPEGHHIKALKFYVRGGARP